MRVDLFDFDLPQSCIATRPARPREAAKLLVVENHQPFQDRIVRDLPGLLRQGDVLVFNDSRVIPAYLRGRCGKAEVEFNLHKQVSASPVTYIAFCKPARKVAVGGTVAFADDFTATVTEKLEGEATLRFDMGPEAFAAALGRHGHMPLPPYIRKLRPVDAQDDTDYQTAFARHEGSVAAPTASLHYTPELLRRLEGQGIGHCFVTLHVGAGTFLPVKAEDTAGHRMHGEYGVVGPEACEAVNRAKTAGGRIIAVGTTALRLLESAADERGVLHPFAAETKIFITPGYRFRLADGLLTNFHLPKSTLFMLVSAFIGLERAQAAYRHAIDKGYRFYSYGDTSLLWKHSSEDTPSPQPSPASMRSMASP